MEANRRVVLDTDVLVDFLRGKESAIQLVRKLKEERYDIATTSINIFELSWGAYKLGKNRVRNVEELTDRLIILNLTAKEAIRAGEEIAYLESIGLAIDVRDLLIGVIARENGYAVITGSIRHFNRIRGLEVLQYKSR